MVLITVIVSVYNQADSLRVVLEALAAQSDQGFEVVVADDGSSDATPEVIAEYQGKFQRLEHVWQEDEGFRLARVRNLGASRAQGDYVIFLDGDCIPRDDFMAQHRRLAKPGCYIRGSRIKTSNAFAEQIKQQGLKLHHADFLTCVRHRLAGRLRRFLPALRLPDFFRDWNSRQWDQSGFCIALYKDDFLRVGGYDESFTGWGREDSEFAARLIHAGIKFRQGKFAILVYHLGLGEGGWTSPQAESLLEQTLAEKRVYARRGIFTQQ